MLSGSMACFMAGAMFSMFSSSADDTVSSGKVTTESAKILIAYYSYSGNTRFAAQEIQKAIGGDLFEIKPVTPYPADYNACVTQARKEISAGVKPKLADAVKDFSKYDVIVVGTPNWWSTMAPPVLTFLASNDFNGKTVVPFVTHGGGGMARCEEDMRKALPKAKFLRGKAFPGGDIRHSGGAIVRWISQSVSVKK